MVREQVREYVHSKLLNGEQGAVHIDDGSSLIKSGLLNSITIVEIITYLEKKFEISVADPDINIDDFDSIDNICSLIARRQART